MSSEPVKRKDLSLKYEAHVNKELERKTSQKNFAAKCRVSQSQVSWIRMTKENISKHHRNNINPSWKRPGKVAVLFQTIIMRFASEYTDTHSQLQRLFTINLVSGTNRLNQGWAISGVWAKCGPPRRFQWPAEALRKDLQTYIPPTYADISSNISQQMLALKLFEARLATITTDLLLFPLEGVALH